LLQDIFNPDSEEFQRTQAAMELGKYLQEHQYTFQDIKPNEEIVAGRVVEGYRYEDSGLKGRIKATSRDGKLVVTADNNKLEIFRFKKGYWKQEDRWNIGDVQSVKISPDNQLINIVLKEKEFVFQKYGQDWSNSSTMNINGRAEEIKSLGPVSSDGLWMQVKTARKEEYMVVERQGRSNKWDRLKIKIDGKEQIVQGLIDGSVDSPLMRGIIIKGKPMIIEKKEDQWVQCVVHGLGYDGKMDIKSISYISPDGLQMRVSLNGVIFPGGDLFIEKKGDQWIRGQITIDGDGKAWVDKISTNAQLMQIRTAKGKFIIEKEGDHWVKAGINIDGNNIIQEFGRISTNGQFVSLEIGDQWVVFEKTGDQWRRLFIDMGGIKKEASYLSDVSADGHFMYVTVGAQFYIAIKENNEWQANVKFDNVEKIGDQFFGQINGQWYELAKSKMVYGLENAIDLNTGHPIEFRNIERAGLKEIKIDGASGYAQPAMPVQEEIPSSKTPKLDQGIHAAGRGNMVFSEDNGTTIEYILNAWEQGKTVILEGDPGVGKTTLIKEGARLKSLPYYVLDMHGERRLSDMVGSFARSVMGQMYYTGRPKAISLEQFNKLNLDLREYLMTHQFLLPDGKEGGFRWRGDLLTVKQIMALEGIKSQWREQIAGMFHYELPLFEYLTHGGIYFADEGAAGEKAEDVLSTLTPLMRNPKTVEFFVAPGVRLEFDVSKDFHLAIAGNVAGKTIARVATKSDINSEVRFIYVQDDQTPEVIAGIFNSFYKGKKAVNEKIVKAVQEIHLKVKEYVQNLSAVEQERHYISKREVRRLAQMMWFFKNQGDEDEYALYKAMRIVYEFGFSRQEQRNDISAIIERAFAARSKKYGDRLKKEISEMFAQRDLSWQEKVLAWGSRQALNNQETLLFMTEYGARTSEIIQALKDNLNAHVEVVDADNEQSRLEIIGGPFVDLQASQKERQVKNVLGVITKYLLEKDAQPISGERIIWVRNIDQWSEEIRTALNGFLEEGYIDVVDEQGAIKRLVKPANVHFIMEMPVYQSTNFSSAAFSRVIKLGVSNDYGDETGKNQGDEVLQMSHELTRMGLFPAQIRDMLKTYLALKTYQEKRMWDSYEGYEIGPSAIYMWGRFIVAALQQDSARGVNIYGDALYASKVAAQEALRMLRVRFKEKDRPLFENLLKLAMGMEELPELSHVIMTNNGQEDGYVTNIGGVEMASSKHVSFLKAQEDVPISYTNTVIELLSLLARAQQTGDVVLLQGEPGSLKTTLGEVYAKLTGKDFYKYQHHVKSRITDLTIDIDIKNGQVQKQERDFYKMLKNGHTVIDFDEFNIAPWMMFVLEPIFRGEKFIFPIFPDEKPFMLGDGLLLMGTRNADHLSLRQDVDRRFEERAIDIQVPNPTQEDKYQINASFWGIPYQGQGREESAIEKDEMASDKQPDIASEEGHFSSEVSMDTQLSSKETWIKEDGSSDDIVLSPETPNEMPQDQLAHGVFSPDLYPYTRHAALDAYDANRQVFFIKDPQKYEVVIDPQYVVSTQHMSIYQGRYKMVLIDQWKPLPSAGAGMAILDIHATDEAGNDVPVSVSKDGAENYFIKSSGLKGECTVVYKVAVPSVHRFWEISSDLPFHYPSHIDAEVQEAMRLMGLTGQENNLKAVFDKMVEFLTNGVPVQGGVKDTGNQFLDLVRSFSEGKGGVCRHAAFVFTRMALALGIPTRFVNSEIHAWVEVNLPGMGWVQLDLGGWGDPMQMSFSALSKEMSIMPRNNIQRSAKEAQKQELWEERMKQALEKQGVQSTGPYSGGGENSNSGNEDGDKDFANDLNEFKGNLEKELKGIRGKKDPLDNKEFQKGMASAEEMLGVMLDAIKAQQRVVYMLGDRGIEVDPLAWHLGKSECFVQRVQIQKPEDVASMYLVDASGSREKVKDAIAYVLGMVGFNLWKVKNANPTRFMYDISSYDEYDPITVFGFDGQDARQDQEQIKNKLNTMANTIGDGNNDLLKAMTMKFKDFMASSRARNAKTKYIVIDTDGADNAIKKIGDKNGQPVYEPSSDFAKVLDDYRRAGIEVFAIGYGEGARYVQAFNGPGLHYVRIQQGPELVAKAIAKIMTAKISGAAIPFGDITGYCGLPTVSDKAMVGSQAKDGGIDLASTGQVLTASTSSTSELMMEDYEWKNIANSIDGLEPVILKNSIVYDFKF